MQGLCTWSSALNPLCPNSPPSRPLLLDFVPVLEFQLLLATGRMITVEMRKEINTKNAWILVQVSGVNIPTSAYLRNESFPLARVVTACWFPFNADTMILSLSKLRLSFERESICWRTGFFLSRHRPAGQNPCTPTHDSPSSQGSAIIRQLLWSVFVSPRASLLPAAQC